LVYVLFPFWYCTEKNLATLSAACKILIVAKQPSIALKSVAPEYSRTRASRYAGQGGQIGRLFASWAIAFYG
jgi:hypothetical protein